MPLRLFICIFVTIFNEILHHISATATGEIKSTYLLTYFDLIVIVITSAATKADCVQSLIFYRPAAFRRVIFVNYSLL